MTDDDPTGTDQQWVERIAERACDSGTTVAVAESLTSGRLSAVLGQGPDTTTWYRGAVVVADATTSAGSPSRNTSRERMPWRSATARCTVPGGLPSCSSGPPTPVIPSPTSAPSSRRTPSAIWRAQLSVTTGPRTTPSTSYFTSEA